MRSDLDIAIVGRYTESGDAELEGAIDSLADLAAKLRSGRLWRVLLTRTAASAAPYDGFLEQLFIEPTAGPVVVARDADTLRIEGESAKLSVLAENIEFLVASNRDDRGDSNASNHMHFEHHPGHFFLSDQSLPLIISVLQPPAAI